MVIFLRDVLVVVNFETYGGNMLVVRAASLSELLKSCVRFASAASHFQYRESN